MAKKTTTTKLVPSWKLVEKLERNGQVDKAHALRLKQEMDYKEAQEQIEYEIR